MATILILTQNEDGYYTRDKRFYTLQEDLRLYLGTCIDRVEQIHRTLLPPRKLNPCLCFMVLLALFIGTGIVKHTLRANYYAAQQAKFDTGPLDKQNNLNSTNQLNQEEDPQGRGRLLQESLNSKTNPSELKGHDSPIDKPSTRSETGDRLGTGVSKNSPGENAATLSNNKQNQKDDELAKQPNQIKSEEVSQIHSEHRAQAPNNLLDQQEPQHWSQEENNEPQGTPQPVARPWLNCRLRMFIMNLISNLQLFAMIVIPIHIWMSRRSARRQAEKLIREIVESDNKWLKTKFNLKLRVGAGMSLELEDLTARPQVKLESIKDDRKKYQGVETQPLKHPQTKVRFSSDCESKPVQTGVSDDSML